MCDSSGSKTINNPINVTVFMEDGGGGGTTGDGSALYNLNASNLTSGHVNSSLIYGNTLSNISASNIVGSIPSTVLGNTVSNLNASNLAFGIVSSSLIYGNTLSNINASNISGLMTVSGNTMSNINASNLAFGHVNSTLIYGNTLSNIQFSNVTGLLPNTISNLNASNLAFGVVNSSLIYGNQISNINSSNITQPFATANIGTLNVSSATTMSGLTVGGPIISTNTSNFANLFVSNLTVTGNFTVTATNTTVTNSLSIVNQGTTTALYVNQNEFPNMTYNVAEFWDHTQLAMVIDGYGNVAVHTASSPGFAFTVVQGASIDTLNVSGISNLNSITVKTLNVTSANVTSENVGSLNVFTGANITQLSVTTLANISSSNIVSLNTASMNVSTFNVSSLNVFGTANGYFGGNFTGVAFTGGTFQGSTMSGTTITASTGFTGAAFTGGTFQGSTMSGTTITASTGFTGSAFSGGTFQGSTMSGTTITASTGFTGAAFTGSTFYATNNIFASNAVTTTNLFTAGFTSNAANTVFNYSTLTVPFINSTTLNVVSTSNIATANILIANVVTGIYSPAVYGGTVSGTTITASTGFTGTAYTGGTFYGTANAYFSNALTTTNIYATGNVVIGPPVTSIQANLHVEQGSIFIGNSAAIGGTINTTSITQGTLVFDNTANVSILPNKIVLYNNTVAVNQFCGFGVQHSNPPSPSLLYYARSSHVWYLNGTNQQMVLQSSGACGLGINGPTAKFHVNGFSSQSNITVRVDSSNIAIATTNGGLVGINTLTPSANLHVIGNVYSSGNVAIGPSITALQANLHVEQGGIFVGNSAAVGSISNTNSITQGRLIFDNTANTSIIPNKIILYSNTDASAPALCGFGVQASPGAATLYYHARSAHYFYTGNPNTNEVMRITSGSSVGIGANAPSAKLHVGTANQSNVQFRIDSSNVAIATTNGGLVGINTLTPSANVHVLGNIYSTTDLVTANSIQTANIYATTVYTTNPISFRNRVINGDFLIDQRNAGAATTPSLDGKSPIDRWKINLVGLGRCQVGQGLGGILAPSGFASYFGMKVTTSNTVGSSDYFFASQIIEGVNTIDWFFGQPAAKTVTLGFWVYSSITGTMGGFVRNAGTSAGNYSRSYTFTFTVNLINTWEYKTITIPGDTTGTWYRNQTDGIEFGIELWNGTTWQTAAGAWTAGNFTGPTGGTINFAGTLNSYVYLTGVQFESGSVATPFERRLYNFELAACQRYYEPTIARVGGYNTSGAYFRGSVYMNTKKRPAPSPTFTVVSTLETSNCGTLNFDSSNFDGSSARYLVPLTSTGDAYGQWKVSVDCEF